MCRDYVQSCDRVQHTCTLCDRVLQTVYSRVTGSTGPVALSLNYLPLTEKLLTVCMFVCACVKCDVLTQGVCVCVCVCVFIE